MAKKDYKSIIENAAKELFCKYGFKRISIEDVCKKAGISRKTFYVYYDNKMDLLIFILENINNNILKYIDSVIQMDLPFVEKMIKISEGNSAQLSTISDEFIADISDPSMSELKEHFEKINKEKKACQQEYFRIAQANGDIRSDINIEFLQLYMNTTMKLYHDPTFQSIIPDRALLLRKLTKMALYGMSGK